jgi:hypothetical protein
MSKPDDARRKDLGADSLAELGRTGSLSYDPPSRARAAATSRARIARKRSM